MRRLRKGDLVQVVTGKDRGKRGEIIRVLPGGERVIVAGVNLVKRHQRPRGGDAGGIIEREASLHASNVMPIDSVDDKPTRVRTSGTGDGKVRVGVRSGAPLGRP